MNPRSPLILIVSDLRWWVGSLESILAPNGFSVITASSAEKALERARTVQPDGVLVDAKLPDGSGLDVCRALSGGLVLDPGTPILINSQGPITRRKRLEALRAGAWDLLGMPLDGEELLLRLRRLLGAKLHADACREASILDSATGVYNLRGLMRRAAEMAAEAARYDRPMACLVFALEPATANRERPRTPEGDAGFASALAILRKCIRNSDVIGRMGPSEIVVLAPETDPDGAHAIARRAIAAAEGASAATLARMRAGLYAVKNFREAGIEPVDLLVRAIIALRTSQSGRGEEPIRFFNLAPQPAQPG